MIRVKIRSCAPQAQTLMFPPGAQANMQTTH
jgi:hypothetical protein